MKVRHKLWCDSDNMHDNDSVDGTNNSMQPNKCMSAVTVNCQPSDEGCVDLDEDENPFGTVQKIAC